MSVINVLYVTGWVALISSWVLPRFVKNELDKSFWGGVLSAFALGVFVAGGIMMWMK